MPVLKARPYKAMASGDFLWQRGISSILTPSCHPLVKSWGILKISPDKAQEMGEKRAGRYHLCSRGFLFISVHLAVGMLATGWEEIPQKYMEPMSTCERNSL